MTSRTAVGGPGTATTSDGARAGVAAVPGARPARFTDVVRSEWTKMRTVRSTYFSLGAAVVATVGIGALIALAVGSHYHQSSPSDRLTFDPTSVSFFGLVFGQLAIGVFGILTVTSEYGSGMIRTTLQAMPRRGWVLGAKAVVFVAITVVIGEISSFVAFFVVQPILKGGPAPYAMIGQAHVLRAVFGAGLYVTAIGLLALGIGALLRNTAVSITVMVALYFVLPGVANALPSSIAQPVHEYLPTGAGQQVASVLHQAHTLSPWVGFAVLCGYAAAALAVAYALLRRRDA